MSLEDVLRLSERHPACRRREAQPGSENLDGDGKGKGTSGSHRKAESTDAPAIRDGSSELSSRCDTVQCGPVDDRNLQSG
jgi:hypothetical protein